MEKPIAAQQLKEEGLRLFQEGLYAEAAIKFEEARGAFVLEGSEIDAAEMVNNQGVIHRMQGNWDEAIAILGEALATFVRLGDRSREAQTLGNLGGLHASKGEHGKAKEYLQQAADIFEELGDSQRQGETLLALGVQDWKTGSRSDGMAAYEIGLSKLGQLTAGQKTVRGLLGFRNRLLGRGR